MHIKPVTAAPDDKTMGVPTLAAALLAIDTWTDLTPSRRALLKASLLNIADMIGDAPALIMLSPQFMRARLLTRSGSSFGIAEGSFKNLRSHLRQVTRRLDAIDTCNLPNSPAWEALLAPLDSREKAALAKLRDYCVMMGTEPNGVSDDMIGDFVVWLEARTLTTKPKKLLGTCRRAWNRFSETQPGWPATLLTASSDTHQYILPLDRFTMPFREDLTRFGSRLSGGLDGDLFTDADEAGGTVPNDTAGGADNARDGLEKPLRAISVNVRLSHARWAASALVASGKARIDELNALVDLVRPRSRAGDILRFIHELRGKTASAGAMHVYQLLMMVMKYEAKSAQADIAWLRRMRKLVTPDYSTMSARRRRRIENVLTPERQQLLLQLPHAAMKQAFELLPEAPRDATSLAMRAVAVQIFLTTQLRLRNVIEMKIGQHLQSDDPANDRWRRLDIAATETKNTNAITKRIGATTGAMMELWALHFRPHLSNDPNGYLFPGHGGKPHICAQGMRDAVKGITLQVCGVAVTPHDFRGIAGKLHLDAHPGDYGTVTKMLGHKVLQTAMDYYAPDDTDRACEAFDELILKLSRGGNIQPSRKAKPHKSKPTLLPPFEPGKGRGPRRRS